MTSTKHLTAKLLAHYRAHPVEFIETVLYNPETAQPFKLLPAQRTFLEHALQIGDDGRLLYDEWIFSCPKKGGKSTFEGIVELTMTLLYGGAFPESYILANSLEQGKGRVFEICCRIINASPQLVNAADITADTIRFPAFNAIIKALPSDAGSVAGTNAVCCGWDELWAIDNESGRRLWDETTPPPTRKIAMRLVVTYAGYDGQSLLLQELYRRGLQQPKIGEDLYAGDGMIMFWSHRGIAPWQDAAWEKRMRRERPSAYQRECLNEFAVSNAQFINMPKWDVITDPNATPLLSAPHLPVFVAVDASFKHDATAIVVVFFDEAYQLVRLVNHRVFQPTPENPLDFEATVEKTLIELAQKYTVKKIVYDPSMLQATMQRVVRAGLPCEEFPQSPPRLTAAAQNLYDLIESQSLVVYPDAEMRLAVSRCVASESSRGWRLTKDKQSHKIDVVISLMMACQAAISSQGESNFITDWSRWIDERDETKPTQTQAEAEKADERAFQNQRYWQHIFRTGGAPYAPYAGHGGSNAFDPYNNSASKAAVEQQRNFAPPPPDIAATLPIFRR